MPLNDNGEYVVRGSRYLDWHPGHHNAALNCKRGYVVRGIG